MRKGILVSLPLSQYEVKRVYRAVVSHKNYEHSYARVFLRDWAISAKHVKPGSLISLEIDGAVFNGYIHDIKVRQDSISNFTELGVIGASYVMRQASQKTYTNVTADQVVRDVARRYGFAYKTIPHSRVYPHITQAGLTDWELMVKLAKQCGYFLRADNTTLYFQPLLHDFDEKIYEARAFAKADAGFKPINLMYSFVPRIGETLAHSGADKSAVSVAGIDPATGDMFKYTKQSRAGATRSIVHPDMFDLHATHVVANSYATAEAEANAHDDNSRFPYRADVEIIGTTDLHPGRPVYLDNIGTQYSGYWTVLGIEHELVEEQLNRHTFVTRLVVGTDSLGEVANPKYPIRPADKPARRIIPNIKNTKIIPKTIINKASITVTPTSVADLVPRINRANPKGSAVAKASWKSTHGDLTAPAQPHQPSPAARRKVSLNDLRL